MHSLCLMCVHSTDRRRAITRWGPLVNEALFARGNNVFAVVNLDTLPCLVDMKWDEPVKL